MLRMPNSVSIKLTTNFIMVSNFHVITMIIKLTIINKTNLFEISKMINLLKL